MSEKSQRKMLTLNACIDDMRHTVRHNGAAIAANASIGEVAKHILDIHPERVKTLWTDINTIDRVKQYVRCLAGLIQPEEPLDIGVEELLGYAVNDERLTAGHHSWAVVRISESGTEILTCGGNFFQTYMKTEDDVLVQNGPTNLLESALNQEDAAWMAESFEAEIRNFPVYSEGETDFYHIPCDLPGNLVQLLSITITRTSKEDGTEIEPLVYSLTDKSCDTSNEGMIGFPHGIWLICDNSELTSAPQGLMIPKDLAEGRDYYNGQLVYRDLECQWETVKITYTRQVSGMARLRLVGDSFGDEYIIAGIDGNFNLGGTWRE